jgi:hypothetical protein
MDNRRTIELDSSFAGLMITYADITEERATERKLRENEERYSRVTSWTSFSPCSNGE